MRRESLMRKVFTINVSSSTRAASSVLILAVNNCNVKLTISSSLSRNAFSYRNALIERANIWSRTENSEPSGPFFDPPFMGATTS